MEAVRAVKRVSTSSLSSRERLGVRLLIEQEEAAFAPRPSGTSRPSTGTYSIGRNRTDFEAEVADTVSSSGIKREVWLFLNAVHAETGFQRWAPTYELFSVSLVIVLVVLDILSSDDRLNIALSDKNLIYSVFEKFTCSVFTLEYALRLWSCVECDMYSVAGSVGGRLLWLMGFLPAVDLIVLIAFYLDLYTPQQYKLLSVIRMIRLLRLVALLKVERKTNSFRTIFMVLKAKRPELVATLFTAAVLMVMSSTVMYYLENPSQPEQFSSIVAAMWWSVTALTTVGYGDIYPQTTMGKIVGSIVAFVGVGLFALPAGILGSGFVDHMEMKAREEQEDLLYQTEQNLETEAEQIQRLVDSQNTLMGVVQKTQREVEQLRAEVRQAQYGQSEDIQMLKESVQTMISNQATIMDELKSLRLRESVIADDSRYPKDTEGEQQNEALSTPRGNNSKPERQTSQRDGRRSRPESPIASPRAQARATVPTASKARVVPVDRWSTSSSLRAATKSVIEKKGSPKGAYRM